MIYLYFYSELTAIQPWVKGFVPPVIFNAQPWTSVTTTAATAASAKKGGQ